MSDDRSVSTFQRRGGNLRSQVIEGMIQNATALDPDLWIVMDQRDNTLIEEEILHGAGSSKYVYSFSLGGTQVAGISVVGARELAAAYGGIQHSLIGSISKVGKLFVMKSYPHAGQNMGLFVQQIPELEGEADYYEVLAELKDLKTGNVVQIEKKEFRLEQRSAETLARNPNLPKWFERPHYQTIAGSKAYRNGVLSIIPQHVQLQWKQDMLKLNKTDIITGSLIDEKRSGVLRYAASKAIGLDRQAVEALTFDQIAGLSDAVREGRAEQFVQSAEALGLIIDAEEQDRPKRSSVQPIKKTAPAQQKPTESAGETRSSERGDTREAAPASKSTPTGQAPKQETQDQTGFDEKPLDENGDPIAGPSGDLEFFDAGAFASWYNHAFRTSHNRNALRENNADALAQAMKDEQAKVLIDAAHDNFDAANAPAGTDAESATSQDAAQTSPWFVPVPKLSGPAGRSNWAKYVPAVLGKLAETKTLDEVRAWEDANVPSYRKQTVHEVRIDEAVAARKAAINRAPQTSSAAETKPDADMKQARGLIADLAKVRNLQEYEDLIHNSAVRSWCERIARERKDIRDMVKVADDAALARVKPPQQDEPPFEGMVPDQNERLGI